MSSNKQIDFKLDSCDEEVRKDSARTLTTKVTQQKFPTILEPERFHHCSSFKQLTHTVVRVQRMIERRRPNKQYNWRPKEGSPLVEELQRAESSILMSVQQHHFQPTISTLKSLEGNETKFQDPRNAQKRNATMKASTPFAVH